METMYYSNSKVIFFLQFNTSETEMHPVINGNLRIDVAWIEFLICACISTRVTTDLRPF